jgi:hypothetical protein
MITITVREKKLRPRDTVEGRVEWRLDKEPKDLELRLCWFTGGRGTEEAETIAVLPLGDMASGSRDFSFVLPGEPWSFDGKLIRLAWGLEVVAKKSGGLALEELVVAPDRTVRTLGEVEEPRSGSAVPKWLKRFTPRSK